MPPSFPFSPSSGASACLKGHQSHRTTPGPPAAFPLDKGRARFRSYMIIAYFYSGATKPHGVNSILLLDIRTHLNRCLAELGPFDGPPSKRRSSCSGTAPAVMLLFIYIYIYFDAYYLQDESRVSLSTPRHQESPGASSLLDGRTDAAMCMHALFHPRYSLMKRPVLRGSAVSCRCFKSAARSAPSSRTIVAYVPPLVKLL